MPIYDWYCRECKEESARFHQSWAAQEREGPPPCPFGQGPMARDMSKGSGKIDFQEKGIFGASGYYDIQTDQTYSSHKEFTKDMERRGLEPMELSDRNKEIVKHRGRKFFGPRGR